MLLSLLKKPAILTTLVFTNLMVSAQVTDNAIDQLIDKILTVQDQDVDYESLYENLLQYYQEPINLNSASADELAQLYLLNPFQINNIFKHIDQYGELLSVHELQAIEGFDLETIKNILPFVTVSSTRMSSNSSPLAQRILLAQNNYLLLRYGRTLEKSKGYTTPDTLSSGALTSRYAGSPDKLFIRIRSWQKGDFSVGFTAEKDAGESLQWDGQNKTYGMDFLSGHFALYNKGKLKTILIGDYQLQYGQGLLFGGGFFLGKSAETVTSIKKLNHGLRPYTSSVEANFFRGAAIKYNLKMLDLTIFYSNLARDASFEEDSTDNKIESLRTTGFHRTLSEIASKNNIREQTAGINLDLVNKNGSLNIGLNAVGTFFPNSLAERNQLYRKFEFTGKKNFSGSLYANYFWQNFNLFGEFSVSKSGGTGTVSGFLASLSPQLALSFLYRHYDKDFHSFYGDSFGESSRNINESGFYWGIKYEPLKQLTFAAYYDSFKFPWLRFRADAPSDGNEYLIRTTYRPKKSLMFYVQFRSEKKEVNSTLDTGPIEVLALGTKQNYTFNLTYNLSKSLVLKSRYQFSTYELDQKTTSGNALIQDIQLDYQRFSFYVRTVLFDTDDFNNRQYAYERNVLYSFSIPAYSGKGIRNILILQYKHNRHITAWLRYARSTFKNTDVISSGLEEIKGNKKTDITFQLKLTL